MKQKFDIKKLILLLEKSDIISNIEIKNIDEIGESGVYKIRCALLILKYKLELRFVKTGEDILYSHQIFSEQPIIRWDNSPHYPKIKTYPHHFHTVDGSVVESELTSDVIEDLQLVLDMIKDFLKNKIGI